MFCNEIIDLVMICAGIDPKVIKLPIIHKYKYIIVISHLNVNKHFCIVYE